MKTKDLIKRLQECDPSGELEVCVNNEDINSIYAMEAYYDGKLQVLSRDAKGRVTGAKITGNGHKVKISPKSIEEAVLINPGLPVEVDLEPEQKQQYEQWLDERRDVGRCIKQYSKELGNQ